MQSSENKSMEHCKFPEFWEMQTSIDVLIFLFSIWEHLSNTLHHCWFHVFLPVSSRFFQFLPEETCSTCNTLCYVLFYAVPWRICFILLDLQRTKPDKPIMFQNYLLPFDLSIFCKGWIHLLCSDNVKSS